LELRQGATVIASNDNWQQSATAGQIPAGFAPNDPREAVVMASLNPGSYTATVRGAGGQTGVGLIEIYDLNSNSGSRPANISTRGAVAGGDSVLIAGVIAVNGNSRVVVRAIGPTLAAANITAALQDPTLELYDTNGVLVRENDNWRDPQQADIEATTIAPRDNREAAIVETLPAGSYTAVVRGKQGTTGIAVVEVYNLQ
jgi:hypothetical protein